MKIIIFIGLLFFGNFTTHKQQPPTAIADKIKSYITYHMSHPAHDWDGTSKEVTATIEYNAKSHQITKVTVSVPITSFDSKNKSRDKNMLDYTEADKYAAVSFTSEAISYTANTLSVSGKLSFHGISKNISFQVTEKEDGNHKIITGGFILQLEDFQVKRPSVMFVKSSNDLKIDLHVEYDL